MVLWYSLKALWHTSFIVSIRMFEMEKMENNYSISEWAFKWHNRLRFQRNRMKTNGVLFIKNPACLHKRACITSRIPGKLPEDLLSWLYLISKHNSKTLLFTWKMHYWLGNPQNILETKLNFRIHSYLSKSIVMFPS